MDIPFSLHLERLSLRHYLILIFVSIIAVIIGFLIASAYSGATRDTIAQDEYLKQYTELNVRESVGLVNQGLTLFDNTLNDKMAAAFQGFLAGYAKTGGDPEKIDLEQLKENLGRNFEGELDLYVINETGVIICSTVPEVMGLDLSVYPDYHDMLPKLRAGNSFAADRVVRSKTDANDTTVTGKLRKFAFMPTPDHRYLLEMGLSSSSFETERADLSYFEAAEKLTSINPNLRSIRVYDVHKNIFTKGGIYRAPSPDPAQEMILDTVLATRSDVVTNPDPHTMVHYIFINQSDPQSASDMSVIAELTYTDAILKENLNSLLVFHLSLGSLAVLLGILSAYGASWLITKPINEIVEDVDIISRGNLDHTIRSMKNDEFTRLEKSINLMIRRIKEESEEIERKNAELKVAAEIQQSFLPKMIEPVPGFDITAVSVPAKMVGGDFYDIIPATEMPGRAGPFGIVIADVSGKGLPAAIFMALSKVIIHVNATWYPQAKDVMRDANTTITAESKTSMFVTAFYGIIDPGAYIFTYVNAGHNPPMVVQDKEDSVRELEPTGIALGLLEDAHYREQTIPIKSGDILVLFTDGVTEATNANDELFSEERLRKIILLNRSLSATELAKVILDNISLFCSGQPQSDDITLFIVKVL
ncbi:MAG: SpoIIE family protein phosphatase [Methanoregulaceae archaeon]|nr:SpoIIE family protein phosphatase [Methanoregulaceae archaeon]